MPRLRVHLPTAEYRPIAGLVRPAYADRTVLLRTVRGDSRLDPDEAAQLAAQLVAAAAKARAADVAKAEG